METASLINDLEYNNRPNIKVLLEPCSSDKCNKPG